MHRVLKKLPLCHLKLLIKSQQKVWLSHGVFGVAPNECMPFDTAINSLYISNVPLSCASDIWLLYLIHTSEKLLTFREKCDMYSTLVSVFLSVTITFSLTWKYSFTNVFFSWFTVYKKETKDVIYHALLNLQVNKPMIQC